MRVYITAAQVAQLRAAGVFTQRGDPCEGCHDRITHRKIHGDADWRAPRVWVELAAAKCENRQFVDDVYPVTCRRGRLVNIAAGMDAGPCRACGGSGAPTIELWAPCLACSGGGFYVDDRGEVYEDACFEDDCDHGSVLVASCSGVTVLPVVGNERTPRPPQYAWIPGDGSVQLATLGATPMFVPLDLDPPPSPGVDWVIRPDGLEWP